MNFIFTMMRTPTLLDRQKGLDHHRSLQRNSRSWTNKLHWMDKLYRMDVIQPVALSPEETGNSNAVDTTLVFYWRYPNDNWIRR